MEDKAALQDLSSRLAFPNRPEQEGMDSASVTDVEKDANESTPPEVTHDAPTPKDPPVNPMHPSAFPDGGLEAWLCVVGGFFALLVSFGWINCIGIFQDYYESHSLKEYSASEIAWIPSLELFSMFAGGPIVGKVYDNYGPRYLILTGTFFHVLGLMMTSLCKEYYQFILAQGICSPIGASMIFYCAINAVSTWFHRHRALATGIVVSGSSLGGVILPIMVTRLIPQIGFGWTMRAVAFLILGCLVISNLTITSRLPPMPKPFRFMDFVEPFKDKSFLLLCIACFFIFWGMFLPFTYIILAAESYGMSTSLAQYLVSILNAASVFGRILPGFIGDRFGRYNVMSVLASFTFIITLAMWIPSKSNAPIIVFTALFGFGSGAIVSLPPALIAQISDVRKIGTRVGSLFFVMSFAALTGSPIGGALVTAEHGKFLHMQIYAGVIMAAGAFFFICARVSLAGWSPLKKV